MKTEYENKQTSGTREVWIYESSATRFGIADTEPIHCVRRAKVTVPRSVIEQWMNACEHSVVMDRELYHLMHGTKERPDATPCK